MALRRKHLWGESAHIPLTQQRYSFGIEWDTVGHTNQELDLQAVIADNHGMIVDAVYFNNLQAMDGAVGVYGTSKDSPDAKTELMWVALSKLPEHIQLIVLVICANKHHSLKDSDNGHVVLSDTSGKKKTEVARFKIVGEGSTADVDVVGILKRDATKAWQFLEIDSPVETGSHFLDILEPTIGGLIRKEIPSAPKHQKVSFNMQKGGVVNLPGSSVLKRLSITLDADVAQNVHEPVDIDIAAVFYGEEGNLLGAADSINDQMFGVAHGGDTHFKVHEQIDESLSVDLMQVPDHVAHVFLVLTISHGTFQSVERMKTRILDQAAHDLATFEVPAGHSESGLILARLSCVHTRLSKRWSLQALGTFFSEQTTTQKATWSGHAAQNQMLKILHQANPDKVALRHSDSHEHHGGHHHPADQSAGPPAEKVVANPVAKHSSSIKPHGGHHGKNGTGTRSGQARSKQTAETPAQASTPASKGKDEKANVASSPKESSVPVVDTIKPESSVAAVVSPAATNESTSCTCSTANHLQNEPQLPPVASNTATERKKGTIRLLGSIQSNPSPPSADAEAKVTAADADAKVTATVADEKITPPASITDLPNEAAKEVTAATEEEVPVANLDEAEVQRPMRKCNDCSWSQRFSLFGSCGANP